MRSVIFWALWHALGGLLLAILPAMVFFRPPWMLGRAEATELLLLLGGYALAALALHVRQWQGTGADLPWTVAVAVAGFTPPLLVLLGMGTSLPLAHVATVAIGSVILLSVPIAVGERSRAGLLVALTLTVVAGLPTVGAATDTLRAVPRPSVAEESRATSLYGLRLDFFRGSVPQSYSGVAGGGIVDLDGEVGVLVTGDGDAYRYSFSTPSLDLEPLPFRAPMNRGAMTDVTGQSPYQHWFRVLDVAKRWQDGRLQLFVSHHYWRTEENCHVVRVSMLEVASVQALSSAASDHWRTVHDTEPCLTLQIESDPGWPFRGMEGGGRMAFLEDGRLLMTVGDHGFNGVDFQQDLVNDSSASYGKTVVIDLVGSEWDVFTTGHRNAQGLVIADDGSIWSSEHGPAGGDEVNLLREGAHYGWPQVTYGTDYGKQIWPLNEQQGRHVGFAAPLFSWTPSIGASAAVEVRSPLFPLWTGDILVASLVSETLYRMRVVDGAPRLVEPVSIGEPVRDLYFDETGRLVIWTDRYNFVRVRPSSMAFEACVGCHQIGDGGNHGIGPDLSGVLGRAIGGAEGFDYSAALDTLAGVWTEEALDAFLSDPQGFAPGTSMQMQGFPDPETRQAVIDYLRRSGQ